jgi:hypothetical protein
MNIKKDSGRRKNDNRSNYVCFGDDGITSAYGSRDDNNLLISS